jgi:ethylbenzene dioxygenase beta subunit
MSAVTPTTPNTAAEGLKAQPFDLELQRKVEQFLFREARLLDEKRWEEWLALFSQDGMYWMPLYPEQTDPYNEVSLFWEDDILRRMRVNRLQDPRSWSQQPPVNSVRAISNVEITGFAEDNGDLIVHSVFTCTEARRESERRLTGRVEHRLNDTQDGWRIRRKRVVLVNAGATHQSLEIFI